jgi:hypothetical protein
VQGCQHQWVTHVRERKRDRLLRYPFCRVCRLVLAARLDIDLEDVVREKFNLVSQKAGSTQKL